MLEGPVFEPTRPKANLLFLAYAIFFLLLFF